MGWSNVPAVTMTVKPSALVNFTSRFVGAMKPFPSAVENGVSGMMAMTLPAALTTFRSMRSLTVTLSFGSVPMSKRKSPAALAWVW